MAAVGVHAVVLAAEAGVAHQAPAAAPCRRPRAGAQHAGGRTLDRPAGTATSSAAPAARAAGGHHAELVGARAGAVVQVVRRGVGLEVGALVLVARVGRRQVGVVAGRGHARDAEAADARARWVGGVGEGPWVVDMGVGEARQRGQRRSEGPLGEQIGGV